MTKHREWGMSAYKHPNRGMQSKQCQGFILLEVLVAMSIILAVWMVSVEVFQRTALNLIQQEAKRSQLRKEFDVFEVQEHNRIGLNLLSKGLSDDATRVSGRDRSMRATTQPTPKNKR